MASSNKCISCNEDLPDDGRVMTCSDCSYAYHVGVCSGISESSYKSKANKAWRCPTCRTANQRGLQGSKQKKMLEPDIASLLTEINAKLDSLTPLKETVDSIEQSMQVLSGKYDEILEKLNKQDGEIRNLRQRVDKMEKVNAKAEIKFLKEQVNELEWRGRRQNLEIHGIPAEANEDLLEKINDVAKNLDQPELSDADVIAVHRVRGKPDKVPGIVVRFARQSVRDKWLDCRRKLRRSETAVHIMENLTKQNKTLLWLVKEWAKSSQYQYTWHRDGKIFVRKRDGERAIVVRCEDDLTALN